MTDELRIKSDGTVPFGLKPAKFVHEPPLEQWPLMPDQEKLWPGDCIKRDAAGRILRVPMAECTHLLAGVREGVAYVQDFWAGPPAKNAS